MSVRDARARGRPLGPTRYPRRSRGRWRWPTGVVWESDRSLRGTGKGRGRAPAARSWRNTRPGHIGLSGLSGIKTLAISKALRAPSNSPRSRPHKPVQLPEGPVVGKLTQGTLGQFAGVSQLASVVEIKAATEDISWLVHFGSPLVVARGMPVI